MMQGPVDVFATILRGAVERFKTSGTLVVVNDFAGQLCMAYCMVYYGA